MLDYCDEPLLACFGWDVMIFFGVLVVWLYRWRRGWGMGVDRWAFGRGCGTVLPLVFRLSLVFF